MEDQNKSKHTVPTPLPRRTVQHYLPLPKELNLHTDELQNPAHIGYPGLTPQQDAFLNLILELHVPLEPVDYRLLFSAGLQLLVRHFSRKLMRRTIKKLSQKVLEKERHRKFRVGKKKAGQAIGPIVLKWVRDVFIS
jgi:hypothetical protein